MKLLKRGEVCKIQKKGSSGSYYYQPGGASEYILHGLWIVRVAHPGTYTVPQGVSKAHGTKPIFHGWVPREAWNFQSPSLASYYFGSKRTKNRSDKGAKVQVARAPGPISLRLRQRLGFGSWQLVCVSVKDKLQSLPRLWIGSIDIPLGTKRYCGYGAQYGSMPPTAEWFLPVYPGVRPNTMLLQITGSGININLVMKLVQGITCFRTAQQQAA